MSSTRPSLREGLLGRWRLARYVARNAAGAEHHPLGEGAIGVIEYSADGKVSVHMMTAARDTHFGYYGDFTVDDSPEGPAVIHSLEMCSDPALVGARNRRQASLEEGGRRLVLSGAMPLEGQPHTIRVTWVREAA